MKLSLAWIFDHLKTSWKHHDIPALIHRFNTTTAEIDSCEHLIIDVDALTLAQVKKIAADSVVLFSPEHKKDYSCPVRNDAYVDQFFLLSIKDGRAVWAAEKELGGSKDSYIPSLHVEATLQAGAWKKTFEKEDYILTIDNIALTHRPDMWCHRGFAREIGAQLGIELVPEHELMHEIPIKKGDEKLQSDQLAVALDVSPEYCKRFAALHIPHIQNRSTSLFLAHRLIRIDSRPISAIVDATNYGMFDIGQPLHAFDANKITAHNLVVKQSQEGQKLTLLDDQEITLSAGDIVITDGKKPLALAGIMGGKETAVQLDTKAIYVESASFVANKIRKASLQYKIRTDASTRFEKSLDPQQNVLGLLRFLKILSQEQLSFTMPEIVLSLGADVKQHSIIVAHSFIERMLGVSLTPDFVMQTLNALTFGVQRHDKNGALEYIVEVPTNRSTKDVLIAQDIVEEVGRYYGFDNIPHELPALPMKPSDLTRFDRINRLKNYCAYAARAHEVRNYALFDEEFLKMLNWQPQSSVSIKNPVSSNMYRLVTSLIPHLLKNVHNNATHKDAYNFFEVNSIWQKAPSPQISVKEHTAFAGIFFDANIPINFYQKKEILSELFRSFGMAIIWSKAENIAPWFHPFQTAELMLNNQSLGFAGMANPTMLQTVVQGSAFIFELNGDMLFNTSVAQKIAKPVSKYQDSWRDVSMLVPLAVTVQQLKALIMKASSNIVSVELVDFFQKDEWHDVRSVTMRFYVRHEERTLVNEEVDTIQERVLEGLKTVGATIR